MFACLSPRALEISWWISPVAALLAPSLKLRRRSANESRGLAVLSIVGTDKRLLVCQAHTAETDVDRALAQLRERMDAQDASATLLFCSPKYDLDKLGRQIASAFSGPVMACTTAGQIGATGFQKGGITAVSLTSPELRMSPYLISPLSDCQAQASQAAFSAVSGLIDRGPQRAFGLVLVDGVSRSEERL